jgi:hypothetical protein
MRKPNRMTWLPAIAVIAAAFSAAGPPTAGADQDLLSKLAAPQDL